jgi:dipeptidyl aminopeptidase/acylaminoacyl peptidase
MILHPRFASAALLFVTSSIPATAQQQQRRGITAEDYYSYHFAADPRISPDGMQVAYVVSSIDRTRNRRIPSIWITSTDGNGVPRELVGGAWNPGAPRWSPDGRTIAFSSGRVSVDSTGTTGKQEPPPGKAQLWTVPSAGGTPRRVTNIPNGVSSCSWSPAGTRFVCLVRTGPSDSVNTGPDRSDVRHYSHILYKFNDTGWFDDKRSHLWVIDATTGSTRQITSGDDWNDTDPSWSPDGTRLAFVTDRSGKEYDDSRKRDVCTIPAAGGALTRVSNSAGRNTSPEWSPDGRTIAYLNSEDEDAEPIILLTPATGGPFRPAASDLDMNPTNLQWADNGRVLLFESVARGEIHLYRIDLQLGAVSAVTSCSRAVRSVDVGRTRGRMVYLANDFQHLDDVYTANLDGNGEKKLTDVNGELWKKLDLASVERMTYKGADDWNIDGFLVKPLGWKTGVTYPMILSIHGGPAGQYGVDWYNEFQVDAAKGYAVFFTNPRGSTGYGSKFERAIANQWGGHDYIDVMNGVRAVLDANPWIDTARLGVTGGSYGGYLTNWIVGHTSLFKGAVTLRSVVNFISDEGTRDGAFGHTRDFGGDLFEKFDLYWDRSPLKYARNVTTPILILHSDNDFRVPLEQGEQWFRALKHFGKNAEIVMFPRENHNLTRTGEPKHLVESLNWQLYWFDKYVNGSAAAVPPDRQSSGGKSEKAAESGN